MEIFILLKSTCLTRVPFGVVSGLASRAVQPGDSSLRLSSTMVATQSPSAPSTLTMLHFTLAALREYRMDCYVFILQTPEVRDTGVLLQDEAAGNHHNTRPLRRLPML